MMVEAEREISLGASPASVWQLLMDFDNYAAWHPFVRLKGEPGLGEIAYTYSSSLARVRILLAPATITRLDPERCFEWRSGVRRIFLTIESYTLEPRGAGTLLIHRLEYRGALSALLHGRLARKANAMVMRTSQSLAAYLARHRLKAWARPGKAGPGKPASGKRRRR
ncbi:carbon monoxide dehydrogenase subunit G [Sphingomonas leidyi]|uniref:Carbon monoxide dehydrogenase subunit G n=1 Tax=Sphingomonas leidyi TaxID=68569 RepID=A0A7X5UYN1_9SPHN|nr:SRPBCC family protein [Sphingomonas leidyi]NIJ64641.1 carbon monoxide dehydrogenase subunit G [Sphingomonas leidyi]